MSFFDDAIKTVGRGLAQTAASELSDATGFDIGGTLNFLFGDGQTTGGGNLSDLSGKLSNPSDSFPVTPQELTYLQQSVEQQQQMISVIGDQLTAVYGVLNTINSEVQEMEQMLNKIVQQQLYQSWETADLITKNSVTAIRTAYEQYTGYIANYSQVPESEIQLLQQSILDPNTGEAFNFNVIAGAILDDGQEAGLLQLWSNMVSSLVVQGVMDYRDAINQYMEYYKKLTFAQLTATNLLMEAYNLNGDSASSSAAYLTYKQTVLAQETTFIQWLMPIINAGVAGSYLSEYPLFLTAGRHACMQLNPNYYTLQNGTEYYSPSTILSAAEKMLQALYCTDAEDRRIVVHMLYFATPPFAPLLAPIQLSLTSCSTESTVPAVSFTTLGPIGAPTIPSSADYPDENWDALTLNYYLKRFVFSANKGDATLPDDTYQVTNINNQFGLVPMGTYASTDPGNMQNASFMTPGVLNYQLRVNETTNFDFMNFLAYNYPYEA